MQGDFERLEATERALLDERGDLFTRVFGLPVSLRISRLFLRCGLGENAASIAMFLSGLCGCILLALGSTWIFFGALLLVAHHLFDYVDGQLARFHGRASVHGAVIDRLNHFVIETATYPALGIGLIAGGGDIIDLFVCWGLYAWNRFRILASSLSTNIQTDELSSYPALERQMMLRNLAAEQAAGESEAADEMPDDRPPWRAMLTQVRANSTSYNSFTLALIVFAGAEYALGPGVLVIGLRALAFYYLLHFFDYCVTYLRTDRIEREVSSLGARATQETVE